jgi:hypothetical protein
MATIRTMVDSLAVIPDDEAPQVGSPAARSWLGWILVVASFAATVSAAVVAFAPFRVTNGPAGTFQCTRPLTLAFAPDQTGTCRWSVAQSRCTLALVLALVGLVVVAVALLRLSRISRRSERISGGPGQLLLLGLSGLGCLILVGLSIAALAVGPGMNQGL